MSDTKPIRQGEELQIENLQEFLRNNLDVKTDKIEILQFPSGSSNLTYCIKIGKDEFVLRRPPFGNQVKSAHDMAREFNVLSRLSAVYRPAPKPIIYCADESVIGSEFYLMERRRGLIIRGKSPAPNAEARTTVRAQTDDAEARKTVRAQTDDAEARTIVRAQNETLENSATLRKRVCKSFIENLANLHALDYQKIGLADLGKPEGYAKRQVEGWTKRYFNAKTEEHAAVETVINWLNENIPQDEAACLVHNDYKFDNIMLVPDDLTKIVAVLDWEMATIGSPLMDLGTTLGYWMSKEAGEELLSMPFNPRVLMEKISRQELVSVYAERSGRDVSNILYYYVFGTFKIAVIAQQIYYRFAKGLTQDRRFANFNSFVGALGKIASNAIAMGKV